MIYFLAIQLDERTKKVLLVLCAMFIILLLIMGSIYYVIEKYMQSESKKMDTYMYDLLKYRIVKNPRQFRQTVYYHEERLLFNNAKWGWRICIILTGIAIALTYILFSDARVFKEAFNLFPNISWPTVGMINDALDDPSLKLSGPSWLPASYFPTITIKETLHLNLELFLSVIYYIGILICLFNILKAILGCIARYVRAGKMSTKVFDKDLDKLDLASAADIAISSKNVEEESNE